LKPNWKVSDYGNGKLLRIFDRIVLYYGEGDAFASFGASGGRGVSDVDFIEPTIILIGLQ